MPEDLNEENLKPIPKEFLSDPDTVIDILGARAYNTRTGQVYSGLRFKREDIERLAAKMASKRGEA